ncbi:Holo-[acyl-carrier-protein] synthase [Lentibacillus sp. JNUCC-1]|uniref:holo-ACP synthase n=1 Tax=Lentibacillus sp. JNUCC-1 TaxID=2654513 RepID=UPI0012E7E628|nr:holo-ACP synthase [Lentibacillus sp. JNUCC-1]MUV38497.1 Holo-[acyl-carrier-protein] synthase [Lentibacillus sp. JNUCC-1]
MIKGIGTDLIELNRIIKQMDKGERLAERVLTEQERDIYHALPNQTRKAEYLGGRFAAKEAFAKAAGKGIGEHYSFKDIEILNNEIGAPVMTVKKMGTVNIFVSISHAKAYAQAFVVIEQPV